MDTNETKEPKFECYLCGDVSNTIDDLKKHGKRTHPNYVKICEKFLAGTCVRNSDFCWYKHEAERAVRHEENVNAPSNQNSHGKPIHKSSNTKRFCHFFQ